MSSTTKPHIIMHDGRGTTSAPITVLRRMTATSVARLMRSTTLPAGMQAAGAVVVVPNYAVRG